MHHLNPKETFEYLAAHPEALLIDCRSEIEFFYVGHSVGAIHVAWHEAPDWEVNPDFAREVLRESGDIDGCMAALEKASTAPKLRFTTASLLARLHMGRGQTPQAIEWFEKAAQAPAPTPDESFELMYDLAAALESAGEVARSLAVSMELQADAGAYRDIAERIGRLSKVQARG